MNNAINPSPLNLELMHARSHKVTKATPMPKTKSIGGLTNTVTGEVKVPLGNSALERLIRFHEGLHSQHTQPWKSKDLLDQALEDARLHRYCSTSRSSAFTQARRDELTIALRDLRGIKHAAKRGIPLNVTASVVIVRSAAILAGNPKYDALVRDCCNLLGHDAYKHVLSAIRALEGVKGACSKQWKTAREYLTPYFREDYSSDKPSSSGESAESESGAKCSESDGEESKSKPSAESHTSEPDKPHKPMESKPEPEPEPEEGGKDEGDSAPEGDKSSKDSKGTGAKIAPIPKTKKTPRVHPLAYKDDLTPDIDAKTYEEMQAQYPLELRIRRLEMAGNRVPCTIGQRRLAPVTGGSRIIASRLASAMANPSVRVFRRPYAKGNAGTILIDASGSMYIPEETLQKFCAEAPALTLAFYNAPSDDYGRLGTTHGNLYVYAANGFRAQKLPDFRWNRSYDWGRGNMIDYQATAWLLKQPGPRYLITDIRTTGPWEYAARNLILKAWRSKLITVLPNLECMRDVLFKTHDPEVKETIDYFRERWATVDINL